MRSFSPRSYVPSLLSLRRLEEFRHTLPLTSWSSWWKRYIWLPPKYLTKWDVSVKSRPTDFSKAFRTSPRKSSRRTPDNWWGRNKIAIPTRPPLISPMTCRLKGWRLFVNLLQIGVIRIMQRPSEKASLAWTNVWIDTHKTKEGEGREKVNVGVLNPLIAARGGYTTQYSKTNRRFLCRLHLLSMTACIMFQQIVRPRFVLGDQTLIVDQGKSSSAEVLTSEIP